MPDNTRIMEEKIDRLQDHFRVYKDDMQDVKALLKKVEICLVGSDINGHKGLVKLIDTIDDRVNEMEKQHILLKDALETYKWSIRAVTLGVVGLFFWWVKK
jgi:hypothetical protein